MDRTSPRDFAERADLAVEDDRLSSTQALAEPSTAQRPKYLSPSSTSVYRQCARKWKYRYVDRRPDPPGDAALAGTFAHRVLEDLMALPADRRTVPEAKTIAKQLFPEMTQDPDYQALNLDEPGARQFRWRAWTAIEGLWTIEDPAGVKVHATEHDVQVEIGPVPFRGIVDRIDVTDDGLVISDYKSGKAPSRRFAEERLNQVLLYAAAVEASTGNRPERARLLYLGQSIIEVESTADAIAEVSVGLADTWTQLVTDVDRNAFDASVGPLCAWCPFVDTCDEGQVEVRRRADAGMVRFDAPGLAVLNLAPAAPLAS